MTGRRIFLIDYGAGNLTSVRKGFAAVGVTLDTPASPADLSEANGIVIPGVGHFGSTGTLSRWREVIRARVDAGVPLLGICLGMQWLFDGSDEAPDVPGLGVIAGTCRRMQADRPLKIPHVGWNTLETLHDEGILAGVSPGASVYFTHSYAAPVTAVTTAITTHATPFAAVVQVDRVVGLQFHPEKSGPTGLHLLRNFAAMVR